MDIKKFTQVLKEERFGVLTCVVLTYSKRKKKIQVKWNDNVRNQRK